MSEETELRAAFEKWRNGFQAHPRGWLVFGAFKAGVAYGRADMQDAAKVIEPKIVYNTGIRQFESMIRKHAQKQKP